MSPLVKNDNALDNKDLQSAEVSSYKPAYKQNPKTAENQSQNISPELTEIINIWPELPDHIKEAIKALVQTHHNHGGLK